MIDEETAPLAAEIRRRIGLAGPIPLAQYMALCLTHPDHGYYTSRDPLGRAGDFITAPEISQMFGELIGLWSAAVWQAMGSPQTVNLVELGPGRGTMMVDALRATRVMPQFRAAVRVHLVEVSPVLRRLQRQALGTGLPVSWHDRLEEVAEGPLIILANEFFDALPVHQAVMDVDGWHERVVKHSSDDALEFSNARDPIPRFDEVLPGGLRPARIGETFEWRTDRTAFEIGRRVACHGGAALILDYGHLASAYGDTLQAVARHGYADPLCRPGQVDLTAHVDFHALAQAAASMGARVHGPLPQCEFLRRLGIAERAAALKEAAASDHARVIAAALERLTDEGRTGMGRLIKAIAFSHQGLDQLPGFCA